MQICIYVEVFVLMSSIYVLPCMNTTFIVIWQFVFRNFIICGARMAQCFVQEVQTLQYMATATAKMDWKGVFTYFTS